MLGRSAILTCLNSLYLFPHVHGVVSSLALLSQSDSFGVNDMSAEVQSCSEAMSPRMLPGRDP